MTERLISVEEQVALAYQSAAQKHADNSGGLLGVVPYLAVNPYEPQRIDVHRIDGAPVLPEELDAISTQVYPAFPKLHEQLAAQEKLDNILSRAAEALYGGMNIAISVNHGSLLDPGITLAAVANSLRRSGAEFRCGIIVGKMLAFQSLMGIPVPDMLKLLCDDIYFTMPNTPSRDELNIDPKDAREYNLATLQALDESLAQGSNVVLFVPDGTTQKPHVNNPNKFVIGVPKSSLTRRFMRPDTLVLPAAAVLSDRTAPFLKLGNLAALTSVDDMHAITAWTVEELNAVTPDQEFTLPTELAHRIGAQALHQDEQK